jgi:hypothetical protein
MASLPPSEVVKLIDTLFAWAGQGGSGPALTFHANLAAVATLVAAIDHIPEHLLTFDGESVHQYLAGSSALRSGLATWQSGDKTHMVSIVPGFNQVHPVLLVRNALARCHESVPEPDTAELQFIDDARFRESLRWDISIANSAFRNREWKPATVLAGSVMEAVLLWAILAAKSADRDAAIADARGRKCDVPKKSPEHWYLPHYIEVASGLGAITKETTDAARVAKDFRNLVHPGRVLREGSCDAGTAHFALGALHRVVRDVTEYLSRTGAAE